MIQKRKRSYNHLQTMSMFDSYYKEISFCFIDSVSIELVCRKRKENKLI